MVFAPQTRANVKRRDRKPKHVVSPMRCPSCHGKVRRVDEETVECRDKDCGRTDVYEAMKAFDQMIKEAEMAARLRTKPRFHESKGQLISEGLELKASLEEANGALKVRDAEIRGLQTQLAQEKNLRMEKERMIERQTVQRIDLESRVVDLRMALLWTRAAAAVGWLVALTLIVLELTIW